MLLAATPAMAETSEEILSKHKKAIGGDAVLSKSNSTVYQGSATHQGFTRSFTWSALAPTFLREEGSSKDIQEAAATDGRHAWAKLFNGVVIGLQGAERDPIRLMSILLNRSYLKPDEIDLTPGNAVQEETGVWTVPMTGRNISAFDLYFDAKSWNLTKAAARTPQGRLTIAFTDFRKEGGLVVPGKVTSQLVRHGVTDETVYTVQKVDRKSELEETLFERPAEPSRGFKLPAGKSATTVPLQYHQATRHLLVKASVNGGEAATFLLDSAAPASMLDAAWAKKAQLPVVEKVVVSDAAGAQTYELHPVAKLGIGELELTGTVVASTDLTSLGRELAMPLAGILGLDVFDRLVVELKYADGTVTFHDPSGYADTGRGEALPLDDFNRVNALVNGQNLLTALLDTGSGAAMTIAPAVAKREKLEPAEKKRLPVNVAGVGSNTPAWLGGLESVTLSQLRVPKVIAVFPAAPQNPTPGDEGITVIGNQLLERFNVTFDLPRRQVLLEQGPWFARPFSYDRSGLQLKPGAEAVVEAVAEGTTVDIKAGDRITAVMTDKGWDSSRAAIDARFQQDAGTKVKVKIKRGKNEPERELTLRDVLF